MPPKRKLEDKPPSDDENKRRPRRRTTRQSVDHSISPPLFIIFDRLDQGGGDNNDQLPPIIDAPPPPFVCPGKNCDHDPQSTNIPVIPDRFINRQDKYKISLKDLIDLGECYHCKLQQTFINFSLEKLAKLVDSLTKLYETIGMNNIKESFADQVVCCLLDPSPNPTELLHTILKASAGMGKSHVIELLAEIYLKMGYLSGGSIKKVKLHDLKGKYVGHTCHLVQKAIDSAIGGVLVIDEAYSLGGEKIDVFSQELIDTLNRNLTEKAGQFICVIAGYTDKMDKCLFAHNEGLQSRFRLVFTIEPYSSRELMEIFNLKVKAQKWSVDLTTRDKQLKFFEDKKSAFKYYGRSMETLFFHVKMAHIIKMSFEPIEKMGIITLEDIQAGYKRYELHEVIKEANDESIINHLYI